MPHRRSSCTPSLKAAGEKPHMRAASRRLPISTARAASQDFLRGRARPSVSALRAENIARASSPACFMDGGRFRGGFHPRRASAERSSSMSDLTFTFTVLLRRASLAKGYCNIYSVSVSSSKCQTPPRALHVASPAVFRSRQELLHLRPTVQFFDPGHAVFLGFI